MKKRSLLILAAGLFALASCGPEGEIISSKEEPSSWSMVPNERAIAVESCRNLSPEFLSWNVKTGGMYMVAYPATVTITPGEVLTSGFLRESNHVEHIFLYVDGVCYKPTMPEGVDQCDELTIKFPVKDDIHEIVLAYSVQQHVVENGHTISLEDDSKATLYGVKPGEKYDYIDCYLLPKSKAFRVSDIKAAIGGSSPVSLNSLDGCSYKYDNETECYRLTIRPNWGNLSGDVVISLLGEEVSLHNITFTGLDKQYVDLGLSTLPSSAYTSDRVYFDFSILPGFYRSSITYTGISAADVTNLGEEFAFNMPDNDVSIAVTFAEKLSISLANALPHATSVSILSQANAYAGIEVEKVAPGDVVYVYAEMERGYRLASASINGGEAIASYEGENGFFVKLTIPETKSPIAVVLNEEAGYYVSTSDRHVTLSKKAQKAGSTFSFIVAPDEGKVTDCVSLKNASGEDVTAALNLALDGNYGSFTMPAYDVTLEVAYRDLDNAKYSVTAIFDEEDFYIADNSFREFEPNTPYEVEGQLGFTIYAYEWDEFYYSVKMGDQVVVEPTHVVNEDGEPASKFQQIILTGDIIIKVGLSEEDVAFEKPSSNKCSVKAIYDDNEYYLYCSNPMGAEPLDGFEVAEGYQISFEIISDSRNLFYVSFKFGDDAPYVESAVEDEESGEYTFSKTIAVTADLTIKIGETEASVL